VSKKESKDLKLSLSPAFFSWYQSLVHGEESSRGKQEVRKGNSTWARVNLSLSLSFQSNPLQVASRQG